MVPWSLLNHSLSIALEIEELQKQKTEVDAAGIELLTKEADLRTEIASLQTQNAVAGTAECRELQRKEQKLQNVLDAQQQQQKQLDKINQKIADNSAFITSDARNIIEFVDISSTGNVTDFGDLSGTQTELCGLSNGHGGLA